MTRRRGILLGAIALALAVVALGALASREPEARLARALARTDELRAVHFEMRATLRADADVSFDEDVRATGDIAFPDRLHLIATFPQRALEEPRELVRIGDRAWSRIGGAWRRIAATGPQTDPRALLAVLKLPGSASFAGYSLVGLAPTYHARIDVAAGRLDVFIGLFDDRIHRQEGDVVEASGGWYRVRTSYAVEYSRFDQAVEIGEPTGN